MRQKPDSCMLHTSRRMTGQCQLSKNVQQGYCDSVQLAAAGGGGR